MSTADWIKLLAAAGAIALIAKAAGGPSKRPSVDGMPVSQNGNAPYYEPGERHQPAYCGVGEAKCC